MQRIFKIVSIFVLSSSILIGLVLLSLQSSWLQNRLVQAGLDSINQSIAGHLAMARFEGSLPGKLTLHQLELTFQNQPVISIDQVQLNFSLLRLLRRQIFIQAVTIQRPRCSFEIHKGQWNLISALTTVSPTPSETDTTTRTQFKWQIQVKNLNLTDARLVINRDSRGLNWQSISIQNLFLASEGSFRDSIAWINIHEFKFSASNPALNLKAFTARVEYSPTSLKIQQFSLDTDSSHFDLNGWVDLRSQSRLQLFCTAQPWHRHDWQLFFPELPFFPSPWISLQANTSADSLRANLELRQAQQLIKLTAACQWPDLENAGYRLAATIRRLNLAEVFHNPALKSQLNAQIQVTGENFQPDQMYLKSQWRMSASVFQQLRIDSTTIQAELQAGRLRLNGNVDFYPGFLHFQGRVDSVFGQPGYRFNLQTEAAPVLSLFGVQTLTDRIPVQAQVRGSGFDWQNLAAFFHLKIPGAVIAGVPIDRVDCQAEWQRGRLTINRGTLTSPIADVFLNGWFSADHRLQAEYLIKVKDLTHIPHTWLPDSMNAAGLIQGTAAGTLDSLRLITRLEVTDFAWPPYQIKRLQADFNGDLFSTVTKFQTHGQSRLELSADGLYLTKNSPLESLQLKAQLAAGELYTTVHLISRPGEQAWLSGKMKSGDTLHCQIDTLALQLDQLTWRNLAPLYLHYVPGGWLQVDPFRLESPQSYLTLQGQLNPTATQNFQCVARNFDLQMLKAWIPDWQYHGLLDADLQLAGTLAAPFITAEIRLKKLAYQQLTADSLYCEMQYRDRLAHFDLNLRLNPTASQFQGRAIAALDLNFTAAESLRLRDILEFKIQSQNLDLALLALFLPELQQLRGDLELQADFKNLLTEPQGTGHFRIDNGRFFSPPTNITYTDISARGELNANKIQLNQFRLRAPQGEMSAQGSLTFRAANLEQFTLRMNFQDFLAINTSEYQAKIAGEAGINGDLQHQNFWGNLTLLASDLQIPEVTASPAPALATGMHSFTVDSVRSGSISTPAPPLLAERLRGTMRIKIPRNCWVRNNLVNVELSGELNLIKEATDWALFGNVNVSRGTVEFYGRKFNIDKGLIQFQGQSPPNPQLYIIASNRLRPIRTESISIQVIVGGTANTPQITLQSEPYLEQKDILAYLVFGKPFDFLTSTERNQMRQTSNSYTQQVGEILVGMAAKQLGQLIAKQLELDIVEFDMASPSNLPGFRIGKYLNDEIFVQYSRDMSEKEKESLMIEYQLNKYFSIRASSTRAADKDKQGIDLFYQREW